MLERAILTDEHITIDEEDEEFSRKVPQTTKIRDGNHHLH